MKTKITIFLVLLLIFSNSAFAAGNELSGKVHPKLSASALVKKSLSLIGKNYPCIDNNMNAFYKEQIQKNNSCVTTNEAILNIKKSSYLKSKTDLAFVEQVRGNCNPGENDQYVVKLQGGPISALEMDVVKNPFLGTFNHNPEESYSFEYDNDVYQGGKEYYVVLFKQKPSEGRMLYRGKIFVDKESLAIGKIEYSRNVENRFGSFDSFFAKKPKGRDIKMIGADYVVKYREFDGKWYFDYSTSNISFVLSNRQDHTYDTYSVKSQIVVTNLVAENFSVDKTNIIKSNDILSDKIKEFNLSSQWDVCNLILLLASNNL